MATHEATIEASFVILIMIVAFIIAAQIIERKNLSMGHETGVVMILGLIVSLTQYSRGR
jgi:hypothetical protein